MGLSFFLGQPFLLFVSCGTGLLAKPGFGFILNCWLRFSLTTSFPSSLKSAVRLRLWLLGFGFTPRYGIHFRVRRGSDVEETESQSSGRFIFEDIICRWGNVDMFSTDNGSDFDNDILTSLLGDYNVHHIKISPYN